MARIPVAKSALIMLLLIFYVFAGIATLVLVNNDTLERLDIPTELYNPRLNNVPQETIEERLGIAIEFMQNRMTRSDGHIYLYYSPNDDVQGAMQTNSEAMSYYLQWTAREGMKTEFDTALNYMEEHMIHPTYGFLQWRLEEDSRAIMDGENMASDADLRTILALGEAYDRWGDERYLTTMHRLASALENYAIIQSGHLAPYIAITPAGLIRAEESWLSYADFRAFDHLAQTRGSPWPGVRENMARAILRAQIPIGFYESVLMPHGNFSNYLDDDSYSINNLWIMVRNSESDDPRLRRSAARLLSFYDHRYEVDTELYAKYDSNGYSLSPRADSPWVYALVARAAIHLNDRALANDMIRMLLEEQETDRSSVFYGSFPEGQGEMRRAGQFTLQESIITLQDYYEYIRS
jgi:endo-1,4-beta-D-glucanase Y